MIRSACAVLIASFLVSSAHSATVELFATVSTPSPEAVAAGAPDGGIIFDAFATTDADILSIGNVLIESTAPLFQVAPPFGSDTAPPATAFIELNRALEADSWITTPGDTSLLGPPVDDSDGTATWGDLSDDGPQNMFHFARLTFPAGTSAMFTGRVTVAGSTGPESFPFCFGSQCIPEPSSLVLASFVVFGLVYQSRGQRRFKR